MAKLASDLPAPDTKKVMHDLRFPNSPSWNRNDYHELRYAVFGREARKCENIPEIVLKLKQTNRVSFGKTAML